MHVYYLQLHGVGVTSNILMLGTVHGIVPVSGICLSACLQRRGRYYLALPRLHFETEDIFETTSFVVMLTRHSIVH